MPHEKIKPYFSPHHLRSVNFINEFYMTFAFISCPMYTFFINKNSDKSIIICESLNVYLQQQYFQSATLDGMFTWKERNEANNTQSTPCSVFDDIVIHIVYTESICRRVLKTESFFSKKQVFRIGLTIHRFNFSFGGVRCAHKV